MDPDNTAGTPSPADSARRIKDAAATAAERAKTIAADRVDAEAQGIHTAGLSTASALRRAADEIGASHGWIGRGLHKSADTIERATQSLSAGDLDRAVHQIGAFARRQPALFIGASVALGFALSRIGKTAVERSKDDDALDRSMGY
jgi:hypothetical protein